MTTNNSPWRTGEYDPELHADEPYKPAPLAQAIGAAIIAIIICLALYGGAQIIANIVAGVS